MRTPLCRTALLFGLSGGLLCAPLTLCATRADPTSKTAPEASTPVVASTVVPAKDKNGKEIPPAATKREEEMGDKATERLEKDPKIKIVDPKKDKETEALYAKLNAMAERIGKASARPLINYKVKIIEDDQVNAFTLPNGNLYFYTGLLKLLNSDDEIAAVMAHEIGHNACMHVLRGDKKSKTASLIGLATILAALAGGSNGANVAAFSQYALLGVMNGYSLEYEKEADAAGVTEMIAAGYNPSAMATVMQRFATEERRRPQIELGIFEDHPPSLERVAAIEKQIHDAGLPFTPRDVSGAPEAVAVADKDRILVKYKDMVLMEFAAANAQDKAALARAGAAAKALNELMRDNLQLYQIHVAEKHDGATTFAELTGQGTLIARVLPADAKLQNLSPLACAQKWRDSLRPIFWRETLDHAL
jgi:predicted Zn-dependent protease